MKTHASTSWSTQTRVCNQSDFTQTKLICDIMWRPFFKCFWKSVVLINSLAQVFGSSIFLPAGAIISMTTQAGPIIFALLFFRGKKRQINIYVTFTFFSPPSKCVWATRGLKFTSMACARPASLSNDLISPWLTEPTLSTSTVLLQVAAHSRFFFQIQTCGDCFDT